MRLMICILLAAGSLMMNAGNAHAQPFRGILPAAVNYKTGNRFWCDAHLQMTRKCAVTEADQLGMMVIAHSAPTEHCEGGLWGFISIYRSEPSLGFTITPDQKFGVTVKDLCRPGTVVTFQPNSTHPDYDDLVGLFQGKEIFRYKHSS